MKAEVVERSLSDRLTRQNTENTIVQNTCNILKHQRPISKIEFFVEKLIHHIELEFNAEKYQLSDFELLEISKLARNKYENWEWNYGDISEFNFVRKAVFAGKELKIYAAVEDNIIKKITFIGNFYGSQELHQAIDMLEGVRINYKSILPKTAAIANELHYVTSEQIAHLLAS